MRRFLVLCTVWLLACGGAPTEGARAPGADGAQGTSSDGTADIRDGDFGLQAGDAKSAQGVTASSLKSSTTHAVLKLIVQDNSENPIPKVVVRATGPSGDKTYTPETDAAGYTETLIPIGQKYQLAYLSLFKDTVEKWVTIPNEPHVTMKLTLTWTPPVVPSLPPPPDEGTLVEEPDKGPALILEGVVFDTAKATLRPESFPHLEGVIEYMTYRKSAIVEVSGHTDNRGNAKNNLKLSEDRAYAVREYLISKGIEGDRIIAVGYGQERPIASNDTEEGRQKNRRTEARDIMNL